MFLRKLTMVCAAAFALNFMVPAHAATYTVTKLADTGDGTCDADCSLREAIIASEASSGADIIEVSVSGTVALTSSLPPITQDLTINGGSASTFMVDGQGIADVRPFEISGSRIVVNFNDLTIKRGNHTTNSFSSGGGGIYVYNNATLYLRNASVENNTSTYEGGGIWAQGTLYIFNSRIINNTAQNAGGGLNLAGGSVLIFNSTISGNTGSVGGGFSTYGTARVENVTISGNQAQFGAGIFTSNSGLSQLLMSNVTLSNNFGASNGGGLYVQCSTTLRNVTVAGNSASNQGGGIFNSSLNTLNIANSIIGDNTAPTGPDILNLGSLWTIGPDVFETAIAGGGTLVEQNAITYADAQLAPLANNGGVVETQAISLDSPALNGGIISEALGIESPPQPLTTDARETGFPRISTSRVDIGAFELPFATTESFVVTTNTDEDNRTSDPTFGTGTSLREAIDAANTIVGDNVITFAANVTGIIQLQRALPDLSSNLEIKGPDATRLEVRGEGASDPYAIFIIGIGQKVTLSGLTLSNGSANPKIAIGGGILNEYGTLVVQNCRLQFNSAVSGGAVSNYGTLTLLNSTLSQNTASNSGAGIHNVGTLNVRDSTFEGNIAGRTGGAIHNSGTFTLENSTFASNAANLEGGGALYNASSAAQATVLNCTIAFNKSVQSGSSSTGGGVNGSFTLHNTIVAQNTASRGTLTVPDNVAGTIDPSSSFNLIGGDPKLGALADNGGPTRTLALAADSPAINAGDPDYSGPLTSDQRGGGFPRVRDGRIDIGAFEFGVPGISVNNPRLLPEGSTASPGSVTFDITLNGYSAEVVKVAYQTTDGTAVAGSDYVEKHGTLIFRPGETRKRVTVFFIGDSVPELNETFFVDLKTPTNATIANSRGTGTLVNDDGPSLSIFDAAPIDEGNENTSPQKFIVRLSAPSTNTIKVSWTTADGTADTTDYVAASGTLTFAPGQTSKIITIQVNGDTKAEANEAYKVNLSNPTFALLNDSQAIGIIRNDDATPLLFKDEPSQ